MGIQSKKTFAMVLYDICNPKKCAPQNGVCAPVSVCEYKVIKQIDGAFEAPMIFQDMCMGCWDCIEACPMDAIQIKQVS